MSLERYSSWIAAAANDDERVALAAEWIARAFEDFYDTFLRLTWRARSSFETLDHPTAVADAKRRLGLYDATVYALADELRAAFPKLATQAALWARVEATTVPAVEMRYEADLAQAYVNSIRRRLDHGEWKAVEYDFGGGDRIVPDRPAYDTYPCVWPVDPATLTAVLGAAELSIPFRDVTEDALRVALRLNELLAEEAGADLSAIEVLRAGFFRNRGAYLVGRLVVRHGTFKPFVLALVNDASGLRVEGLLHTPAVVHNLFSSTEAPFLVTSRHYHELCAFLHSIMPDRPLGLHYSSIGYHHVSKVAVMTEVRDHLGAGRELLSTAPGSKGTVAIAFTARGCDYVLKVIRDQPTSGYKWTRFDGVEAVLAKYSRVHEINRAGSMLDNIIYRNLKLDRSWFDRELLQELSEAAPNAVRVKGTSVVFSYLLVQRKLTPLDVFLKTAPPEQAAEAVSNLGHCIRTNAAANIFNKDFDVRNYGVSRYLKVYLYDYDSIELLTDVKVRTNVDRLDGEEDVPDWFFESGVVFLPEEIEAGLRVPDRALRRSFRAAHADLMTVDYWESMQAAHRAGEVPGIQTFPETCRLGGSGIEILANE